MRMSMFCQAGTGIVQHATADSSFCIGCSRAPFHARVSPFAAQRTSGKRRVWAAVNGLGPMAPQRADSSKQSIDSGSLSGFFERIADCNAGGDEIAALVPFDIGGITCGYLRPAFAEQLASLRHFQAHRDVENTGSTAPTLIRLDTAGETREDRTAALADATRQLRDAGAIKGWRDELYPVTDAFHDPPLALIERAAAAYFGIKAFGVHINGYVVRDGQISLWVAKRAAAKQTWPSLLDHIVAGGQPAGLSCMDNVVKECQEEASIPAALAKTARPVGVVSYAGMVDEGLKRDVLFCYDLQLPPDFRPTPQDGEVESFELVPIEKVARIISEERAYKPNCCLVIIDFLIRHGVLTPEHPGYDRLVFALRP